MSFSVVLNDLMRERNISQSQLAKKIGYSQRAVSKWINNQSEPTETPIILCAKFFGVSTDDILGYTDFVNKQEKNSPINSLQKHNYSDELKLIKIYSMLSDSGKARIIAYSEFVSEEEKTKINK